ncbi:MAG TPA: T9SS type A sorting domain-containing protein [Bacteroidia bacterium]|jgi:hypothetical protein
MKKILLILSLLSGVILTRAQSTFERILINIPGDSTLSGPGSITLIDSTGLKPKSVFGAFYSLDGGGYISLSNIAGVNSMDFKLVKTDEDGAIQWKKTIGGWADDEAHKLLKTPDGGFIITGKTKSAGSGSNDDVFIIKTDSDGNVVWSKTYGGSMNESGHDIIPTNDGGYVVAGETDNSGNLDMYIIKIDFQGNYQWSKAFGGPQADRAHDILEDNSGFLITGETGGFNTSNRDVYLVKTDFNGSEMWSKAIAGTNNEIGRSSVITSDGGYAITGATTSFGSGMSDVFLVKTDSIGAIEWQKSYGGEYHDEAYELQLTEDGGFVLVGETSSFDDLDQDLYILKMDSSGGLEWSYSYGGPMRTDTKEIGLSVNNIDGGLIIGGFVMDEERLDPYLIKADMSGATSCNPTILNTLTMQSFFTAATLNSSTVTIANLFIGGGSITSMPNEDVIKVSYSCGTPPVLPSFSTSAVYLMAPDEPDTIVENRTMNEEKEFSSVVLYPNPSEGTEINLRMKGTADQKVSFNIYDALGRVVYSKTLQFQNSDGDVFMLMPEEGLAKGTYLCIVSSDVLLFNEILIVR